MLKVRTIQTVTTNYMKNPEIFTYCFNRQWWRFQWRYWRGQVPWDTNITPPEVMAFLEDTPPARALDLGCGTGTNAITLTRRGWQVTAIDFSPKAIRAARRKAVRAGLDIDFQVGDVSDLSVIQGPFDYALDIGCLFSLNEQQRRNYAMGLKRLVRPDGRYMLYTRLQQNERFPSPLLDPLRVKSLFAPGFSLAHIEEGRDRGSPSVWYWLKRNPGVA